TVIVKKEKGKKLGEAQVDENGDFEVDIPKQKAKTKLTVTVTDKDGKELDEVTVEVEKAKIDTTELEKLIEKAKEYKAEDYTEETYKGLEKSISKAEKVVKEAKTQEEIEEAITQLEKAIEGMEKEKDPDPEVDTTELEKLIEEAKAYKAEDYT